MKSIFYILLLFTISISAQTKGVVVDENNNPIPYVNIWVENENIGTTSDEKGFFEIKATIDKTLVFSSVGFEIKKLIFKHNDKVVLKSIIYKLDEVVISKRKNDKELEIGDSKKIHHKQLSGDKPWIYGKLFEYDTIYSETPFIKKITFFTDSEKKGALLKIRIFEFNDSIPTKDLLNEDLIISVKKGMEENEIDVSKYNLRFPEKGIVIGLEWMIIEENKYYFEYKDSKTKEKQSMLCYSPSLVINYSDKENAFRYSGGKWFRNKLFHKESNEKPWYNKVMTPAINLILTN